MSYGRDLTYREPDYDDTVCAGCGAPLPEECPQESPAFHGYCEACWKERHVTLCACGVALECTRFTNTCSCGRDYNWNGQLLAPRSCWGEETGETAGDILRAEAAGFPEDEEW